MRCLPLTLLVACGPKVGPTAVPTIDRPAVYNIGVVVGSGERLVSSYYSLRVVPRGDDVCAFTTLTAAGTWEQGDATLHWNSEEPTGQDPWPVTIQHAIASVPAQVHLNALGMPTALRDEDTWLRAARAAVQAAGLPIEARAASEAMLDPESFVRDLRRNFPGAPNPDGTWSRDELVAGLPARRVETCESTATNRTLTWDCSGTVEGPQNGVARLVDMTSTSKLTVDRKGVVEFNSQYDGTMVVLAPDGRQALDRPVAGIRAVVRQ